MMQMRRKRMLCMVSVLTLIGLLFYAALTAYAIEGSRITDEAELLSYDEEQTLNESMEEIAEAYDFDVYLLSVRSLDGEDIVSYADNMYDENGYGLGEENSGILFIIDMDSRDFYFTTAGWGIDAFSDGEIDAINQAITPSLSEGNYGEAFQTFFDCVENEIDSYVNQTDDNNGFYERDGADEDGGLLFPIFIVILVSFGIGTCYALYLKGQLNNAVSPAAAGTYVKKYSFQIKESHDYFLYSHVTRTKIVQRQNSGGSSHTSAGGVHHGGGGGHF